MGVGGCRIFVALCDVLEGVREQLARVGLLKFLSEHLRGLLILRFLRLIASHHIIWQQHIRQITGKEALTRKFLHIRVFFFFLGQRLCQLIDLHPAHFLGDQRCCATGDHIELSLLRPLRVELFVKLD